MVTGEPRAAHGNSAYAAVRGVFQDLGLLLLSSLLFALSFPGFAATWGLFPLGFVALAPVFIVVRRSSWPRVLLYGLFAGYTAYSLFNYWLAIFHPLTIFIVPPLYAVIYVGLFAVLKAAAVAFPRRGHLVQVVVWVGYEFLKVQGFLGYPWGVMGYSQYAFTALIRVAALTGVWGVSLLVVYPSAALSSLLRDGISGVRLRIRGMKWELGVYAVLLAAALGYGLATRVDLREVRTVRVALIQQNADPWKTEYARTLDTLIELSTQAMEHDPDLVVWSETSFVPAIDWHTRYRLEKSKYDLVRRLQRFLADQPVPYVVGNDDGQLRKDMEGRDKRVDYNAALLYSQGEVVQAYRKVRLVPFTENFPFQYSLPRVYELLDEHPEIHLWEQGEEFTVFDAAGVRFSTPICFEDSFGYLSRAFVRAGAEMIVNLTNDSWSGSVAAEVQHMSMAVFRAVENRRTVVRSTNGGITSVIDPNGRIIALLDPFVEAFLIRDVPVYTETTTLYTRRGDWLGVGMCALGGLLVAGGTVARVLRGRKRSADRAD